MATNNKQRIRVAPGIYRRGDVFDIRVTFKDRNGDRRQSWETVRGGLREAKSGQALLKAAAIEGNLVVKPDGRALTVERFLTDYYLPYLWDERLIKNRSLAKTTYTTYRRYALKKIIPAIGMMPITAVNSGHIEKMLNNLLVGGRDPADRKGRPAAYPKEVYDLILRGRSQGFTYSEIAALVNSRYGAVRITLSKDAVASIYRRHSTAPKVASSPDGLSVKTVRKVYWMLQGAWAYGVKHELIPRDRAHVVPETDCPTEGRWATEPVKTLWEPRHYSRLFDWAVHDRPESWVAFCFVATSGDRISGNLGLGWSEVDLDHATARLVRFVKYHGEPGQRVLVERVGKTGLGQEIQLDPRTVEVLRREKARQSERLLARADRHECMTEDRDCPMAGYHDRGLVLPQRNGNYRDPNKFLTLFQDAIRAYNRQHPADPLPVIDLHALRYGWTTTAEAENVSELVRMDRLGHKTVKMNRHYTKPQLAAKAAAAAAVSDALFADSVELGKLGS